MPRRSRHLRLLAAIAGILASCKAPPAPASSAIPAGEWRTFEGTWTAAGERHELEAGPDHVAVVADLSGSVLLIGERGLGAGFQLRVLAYSDGQGLNVGRAVFTDEQGDRIFSELKGQAIGTGHRVNGAITGGTGRWTGISGEYTLNWKYVVDAGGRVSGRSEDLRGRARIVPPQGARR